MLSMLRSVALAAVLWLPVSSFAQTSTDTTWIDDTVLYGIAPWYFARGHDVVPFQEIKRRLPEIARLGANITLWLMPIYEPGSPGQAYDVKRYKRVWHELGSEADLKQLIEHAHSLGMKVIFDLPINHSSKDHPYAEDVIRNGSRSAWRDVYDTTIPSSQPYGEKLNTRSIGKGRFLFYFWEDLLTFNFGRRRARAFVIDVAQYWLREFGIDGYRFDASWGVAGRWPVEDDGLGFYQVMARALRAVKPDILLLAEDKAGYPVNVEEVYGRNHPHVYKNAGFNLAYDWNSRDRWWVSKWAFQTGDSEEETVFNSLPVSERANMLRQALVFGQNLPTDTSRTARVLRFLENNDTTSFISHHSRQMTKLAASLMFLLPRSVPMIFYGQEVGYDRPEKWQLPSFDPRQPSIEELDPDMFGFYRQLIATRTAYDVFRSGVYAELDIVEGDGTTFAYQLQGVDDQVIVALNLGEDRKWLTIKKDESEGCPLREVYLSTGEKDDTSKKCETDRFMLRLPAESLAVYLRQASSKLSAR